jgi:hypothetical protein
MYSQDKQLECIVELAPVVVAFAKNPAEGAAGLLVWPARCLPELGSYPVVGRHRRRRVLHATATHEEFIF